MLSRCNVNDIALGGLLRLIQILQQSRGYQANHRSRAFGKTNQAPIQCFNERCFVFVYKPRSLGVERYITSVKNQCFIYCAA